MPSLSQLLTDHGSLLVLDAASMNVQVGLLRRGKTACWHHTLMEAGTGIFTCTEAILEKASVGIDAIDAFVFCEGPGSMLGTRTVAMALRTWQVLRPRPAYAYQSLALAALCESARNRDRPMALIADARRDSWYCQPVSAAGLLASLQRLPAAELPDDELVTPEHFRTWTQPPRPPRTCPYDLQAMLPVIMSCDCLHAVQVPDAFQYSAPVYRKWSAQIHRPATVGFT